MEEMVSPNASTWTSGVAVGAGVAVGCGAAVAAAVGLTAVVEVKYGVNCVKLAAWPAPGTEHAVTANKQVSRVIFSFIS
jgi:hypothetical protein